MNEIYDINEYIYDVYIWMERERERFTHIVQGREG